MKKIGIIGAMEAEIDYLKKLASVAGTSKETLAGKLTFVEGAINGANVVIVKCGVGKVNAALCAQRLIMQFGATHIINTGIAGAIAHGLKVFDMVVSSDAVYHDMDATRWGYKPTEIPQMKISAFPADKAMIQAVQDTFANGEKLFDGHQLILGRIASGDQFIADKEIKARIVQACSPACVEMEGAAIAHTCYMNDTPYVILRCMSDMADETEETTSLFNESSAAEMSAKLVEKLLERI